jgi:ribosomal protein L11 methylase PrmA
VDSCNSDLLTGFRIKKKSNRPLSSDPGSYRDPSGAIFDDGASIYRSITAEGIDAFEQVWAIGYFQTLVDQRWLLPLERKDPASVGFAPEDARALLQHPRLSFVSYPYEWPFEALKAAALLHLDIQLDALERNVVLSDASAYNIQFRGWRPVFIDHLSFRPYREGEIWAGHRQFLEQFLNPLLLRALLGVSHNFWYRGALEGIPTADLNRILPLRRKFSVNVLSHVTLPARFQAGLGSGRKGSLDAIRETKFPRASYRGILERLRSWIAQLTPLNSRKTTWQEYEKFRTYDGEELEAKRRFVSEFIHTVKPRQLFDLGCNTGEFSALAIDAGCGEVIGLDFDQGALDLAYQRARENDLNFLPLFLDAANPSPGQGWMGTERKALAERCQAEALVALAFVHHLVIARNIPLKEVLIWLLSLAPQGVIEFVPKQDETVQILLQLREDIFPRYTEENFLGILSELVSIHKSERITESGRLLVWYQ